MSAIMAEQSGDETEGVEVECHKCGYTWIYKGQRWTATCPNCQANTDTGLGPEDDDE